MSPAYSINGGDWSATLTEAKTMSPKPYLLVSVDGDMTEKTRNDHLMEIARVYQCVAYKCFYR